jgi:hypothetical protein
MTHRGSHTIDVKDDVPITETKAVLGGVGVLGSSSLAVVKRARVQLQDLADGCRFKRGQLTE